MPVQNEPLKIDPYTTTVPLVQQPVEQNAGMPAGPLQGQFGGHRGTGAMVLGDALLKGFMQGHQIKEARRYATAQATINAADSAAEAAYGKFQDALTAAKGDVKDTNAAAAYSAYLDTFNQAKQAKAQFVIPPKTQKGQKAQDGAKGKDGKKSSAGFNNIRDFFEANPHIVPQIALLTMQPKPPTLSPQGQAQNLELQRQQAALAEGNAQTDEARRMRDARSTYALYANLDPQEFDKLDPVAKDSFRVAKNMLFESQAGHEKYQTLVDPTGQQHSWPIGEQIPPGWKLYEKPTSATTPRIGTEGEFTAQAYAKYGVTPQTASPELSKYIHDWWQWKAAQTTSSTSGSTVDEHGNRVTTNTATRGVKEPQPPAGFAPISEGQGRGIEPPPQAGASQKNNFVTQSFRGRDVPGMVSPGNVDITQRPNIKNADGSHSSVFSMSSEVDGKEVLYPGVGDGTTYPLRKLTPAEALDQYKKTGKSLGAFKDAASADAYAKTLHEDQAKYGNRAGGVERPPTAAKTAAPGRVTPPPGKRTLTDANREDKHSTEKEGKYAKVTKEYNDAVAKIKKDFGASGATDPAVLNQAIQGAAQRYAADKAQIVLWDADFLRSHGVDPWKTDSSGKQFATDAKGNTYGTMDGINWVNINTGMPYQE